MADRIKPIEIYKYEPDPENPPYLRYLGNRTVGEVYRELVERLEADGLLPEEYFDVVYESPVRPRLDAEFPRYLVLACYPVTGRSEGHYVHVDAFVEGDSGVIRPVPVFLGKTFRGFEFAAAAANACARHLGA
ncbi:hypothetical protein SAMN00808754_1687 [Thermanaeromonas toyohensis ToBE]|uniref:Uncharacterized protein n=1 Tax=Thermanaeromonas toyohensis ToBE TaxID=698762 RepID=A0A1W1VU23_9FIRM|nr:hypothetical protein [Thermanaeromonas toyohensis]SMB96849.1 hypothetical protein SAMN00808754_1687 [Thermanaeromonas toyohensis ToBE]